MYKPIFTLSLLLITFFSFAGKGSDSLRAIIYSNQSDTSIVTAANKMAAKYEYRSPDTCLFYAKKAYQISKTIPDSSYKMISLYNLGLGYYGLKQYDECIENCEKALKVSRAIKDTIYEGVILYKLSRAYSKIARYDLTIKAQLEAIRYYKKIKNAIGVAVMYNNMSIAYKYLGDNRGAIRALRTSLVAYKEHGDSTFLYTPYLNIGDNYLQMAIYDSARLYLDSAIYLSKKHNKSSTTEGYINYWIGEIYYNQKDYVKALKYYESSHESRLEHNDIDDQTYTFLGIGKTLLKLGKTQKAMPYLRQALDNAEKSNAKKRVMMSHEALSELYYNTSDYKNAIEHLRDYVALKDTIFNDDKAMAIMSARTQFDVENKDKEIEFLNMKNAMAKKNEKLQEVELQKTQSRQQMLYLVLAIALLSILGLFFIIRKRNQTNKLLQSQKNKIEQSNIDLSIQKQIVEEKNKEITDSIQYAKRIQNAILPTDKLVKEYLSDSFILYKPKDIVAGDFYWMEHSKGKVLFAAADCTGHGVPGAMVSVVCNNGLNRSVREYGLIDPGEILDKTREIVIQEFDKSEDDVQDGMDIALCSLSVNSNQSTVLQYAGANNPLWIIRNGEILETKANKQPIGKFDNPEPYITHTIELQQGDSIYIFSDGYIDQFGGEKGKKLKASAFRELLLKVNNLPLSEQKIVIDKAFEDWRGDNEQVDDVCVIGVRI